jgi:hypothetical protein
MRIVSITVGLGLGLGLATVHAAPTAKRKTAPVAAAKKSSDGNGEVRSIQVHGVALDGKTPETGSATEHTKLSSPAEADPYAPPAMDEDLVRERVTKGMRRYEKAIDACIDATHKKRPTAAGQLDLSLQITERRVTLAVAKDGVGDAALVQCITKSSKTWELPAASLTMPWSVTLAAK